jgi:MazG family protein
MPDVVEAENAGQAFARMLDVIRALRSENGCPWDKEQTAWTFHPYILEEYHEMLDALSGARWDDVTDEMGDLLFIVAFTAYLFEQQGFTSVTEIIDTSIEKMVRRHPHVFGELEVKDSAEVIRNWRRIKAQEKSVRDRESLLDGIPRSLPAAARAQKLAARAARVGFDWANAQEVFPKIDEELAELKKAAGENNPDHVCEEIGDLLFVVINAARRLGVNAEAALNETGDKFERRFRHIERALHEQGKNIEKASLAEMDELWDDAKAREKDRNLP